MLQKWWPGGWWGLSFPNIFKTKRAHMEEAGNFLGPLPEKACRRNKNHRSNGGDLKLMIIIDEVYFWSIVKKWALTLL